MVGLVVSWINQLSPEPSSGDQQGPPSSEFQLMCVRARFGSAVHAWLGQPEQDALSG